MRGDIAVKTIIKPSAAIRQNYNEISEICKETGQPVFLYLSSEKWSNYYFKNGPLFFAI